MAELPLPPPPPPPPDDGSYNPFGISAQAAAAAAVGPPQLPATSLWEKANEELYKLHDGNTMAAAAANAYPPHLYGGYPPPYSMPPWNYGYAQPGAAYGYPPYGVPPFGAPAYARPPAYYGALPVAYGAPARPMYPPGPPPVHGTGKKATAALAAQQQHAPHLPRFSGFKSSQTTPIRPLSNSGSIRISLNAAASKNVHRFAPPPSNLPPPLENPNLKKPTAFDHNSDSKRTSTGSSSTAVSKTSTFDRNYTNEEDDDDGSDSARVLDFSALQSNREGAMGMLELARHHQQHNVDSDNPNTNKLSKEELDSVPLCVTIVGKNRPMIPASTNANFFPSSSFNNHSKPTKFKKRTAAAAAAAAPSFPPPPLPSLRNRPLLPGGPKSGSNATEAGEIVPGSNSASLTPSGGVIAVPNAIAAAAGADLDDPAVVARVELMRIAGTRTWPPGVVRWIERSYAQQPRMKWMLLKNRLLDIITEEEDRGGLNIINWDLVDTLSVGVGTSGIDNNRLASCERRRDRRGDHSPSRHGGDFRSPLSRRTSGRHSRSRSGSSTSPGDDSRSTRTKRSVAGSSRHYGRGYADERGDNGNDSKSHRSSRMLSVVSSKALSSYGSNRKSGRRSRSNSKSSSIYSSASKLHSKKLKYDANGGLDSGADFVSLDAPKQLIKKYVSADGKKLVTSLAMSNGKFRGPGSMKAPSVAGGNQFRSQGPQTEQDKRKLAERAHRFQGMLDDDSSSSTVPEKADARTLLKRKQQQQNSHFGDGDEHEDYSGGPIIGTCEEVFKQFLRLTAAPDPSKVRPERVLRRALPAVMKRWNDHHDYADVKDQLKSIRQDITVQQVRNDLTAAAYEAHARVALVVGDKPEFNQCQQQLKALYKDLRQRRNELLVTAQALRDMAQQTGLNADEFSHSIDAVGNRNKLSAEQKTSSAVDKQPSADAEKTESVQKETNAVEFLPAQARDELAKLERALECEQEFLAYRLIYCALHWNLSDFANDKSTLDAEKLKNLPATSADEAENLNAAAVSIQYALGVANAWFSDDTFAFFKYAERSPANSPHGIEHYLLKWAVPALRRKLFTRMIISACQPAVDVEFVQNQLGFGRVWTQFDYREANMSLIADLSAGRRRQIGLAEWQEFVKIWDGIVFGETESAGGENVAEFDCKTMKKSLRIKPET